MESSGQTHSRSPRACPAPGLAAAALGRANPAGTAGTGGAQCGDPAAPVASWGTDNSLLATIPALIALRNTSYIVAEAMLLSQLPPPGSHHSPPARDAPEGDPQLRPGPAAPRGDPQLRPDPALTSRHRAAARASPAAAQPGPAVPRSHLAAVWPCGGRSSVQGTGNHPRGSGDSTRVQAAGRMIRTAPARSGAAPKVASELPSHSFSSSSSEPGEEARCYGVSATSAEHPPLALAGP